MDKLTDNGKNWLKDAVENSTEHTSKKTLTDIFHRMRIVEELVLAERLTERQSDKTEDLNTKVLDILTRQDNLRQQNIKDFPQLSRNPDTPEWYEPYDLSQQVVTDGVNWYLHMKKYISGKDFLIAAYLNQFIRKLYLGAHGEYNAFDETTGSEDFSGSVISLVESGIYETRETENEEKINDEVMKDIMGNIADRGAVSELKFIDAVKSLAMEFDRIYSINLTASK